MSGSPTSKTSSTMKYPIWRWFASIAILCGFAMSASQAKPKSPEAEARQLWQLLDYVSVDYAGAVQNGSVISEVEY